MSRRSPSTRDSTRTGIHHVRWPSVVYLFLETLLLPLWTACGVRGKISLVPGFISPPPSPHRADKDDAAEAERSNRPSGQRDEKKGRRKDERRNGRPILGPYHRWRYRAKAYRVALLHPRSLSLSSSLAHPCSLIPPPPSSLYSSGGSPLALWHGKLRSRR